MKKKEEELLANQLLIAEPKVAGSDGTSTSSQNPRSRWPSEKKHLARLFSPRAQQSCLVLTLFVVAREPNACSLRYLTPRLLGTFFSPSGDKSLLVLTHVAGRSKG